MINYSELMISDDGEKSEKSWQVFREWSWYGGIWRMHVVCCMIRTFAQFPTRSRCHQHHEALWGLGAHNLMNFIKMTICSNPLSLPFAYLNTAMENGPFIDYLSWIYHHPCMLYMVTWIPSICPLYVSINIPAPWILWVMIYLLKMVDLSMATDRFFISVELAAVRAQTLGRSIVCRNDLMAATKNEKQLFIFHLEHILNIIEFIYSFGRGCSMIFLVISYDIMVIFRFVKNKRFPGRRRAQTAARWSRTVGRTATTRQARFGDSFGDELLEGFGGNHGNGCHWLMDMTRND